MRVCSIDGCTRKHEAKGFCVTHYRSHRLRTDPAFAETVRARDRKRNQSAERKAAVKALLAERGGTYNANKYYKDVVASRAKGRLWHAEHRDQASASAKARYQADADAAKERATAWRLANPERRKAIVREWGKANKGKRNAGTQNRRAGIRQAEGKWTDADRVALLKRYGHVCPHCGTAEGLTVDHIVPLAWGGNNFPWNLSVLCGPCNQSKNDRWIAELLPWDGGAPRFVLLEYVGSRLRNKKPVKRVA